MLGHAVTENLIDWKTLPPALQPDPSNKDDDLQPWTGCALWHKNLGYLFYTMRGSANGARQQKIGLATSSDLFHWQRHPGNPVLVPDESLYATAKRPTPGVVDCRDLQVISAPHGGWYGFFATRQPGDELPETAVIGCAYSEDLIHWQQLPPAFAPNKYACIEVPDVFQIGDKWYLLCLTGNHYGNRDIFNDPNLLNGTIYAVAERPQGPYRELADNALMAVRWPGPVSAKSVRFQDTLYVLYTDRERTGTTDSGEVQFGTISTPKELRVSGDELVARYSPLIETRLETELFSSGKKPLPTKEMPWAQYWPLHSGKWQNGDTIQGECRSCWSVQPFDCHAESYIFEARIEVETAVAAGFALRMNHPMVGGVVALDATGQSVFFADAPSFDFQEKRRTSITRGRTYHLRVVQRLEHIEIYLDDMLKLAFSHYHGLIGGGMGLFVDRGKASFSQVRIQSLRVTKPE